MALAPGYQLTEKLQLVAELGHGAMGAVWTAQNLALGNQVAVKVMLPDTVQAPEARARFAQEARGAASIDSPHVVQIFDYGISPAGEPYIAMELLRGSDLKERIALRGALPLEDAVQVIEQLARALSRAHELGVIHRDIKPANLFLTDAGGSLFLKVLDFGVAKYAALADMQMTATGAMMGTPNYMSPEQLLDPRSIDHRSDLWAVAIVAYECLTGRRPFEAETIVALNMAIHTGAYTSPKQLRPELPSAIDMWFSRALAPEPEARFASATEMAARFKEAAGSAAPAHAAPVSHAPAQAPPVSQAPAQAPPVYAPVSHAPAMTGPAAYAPSTAGGAVMSQPHPYGAPPKGGSKVGLIVALLVLIGGGIAAAVWLLPTLLGAGSEDERARAASEDDDGSEITRPAAPVTSGSASALASASTSASARVSDAATRPRSARAVAQPGRVAAPAISSAPATAGGRVPDTSGFAGVVRSCWRDGEATPNRPASSATVSVSVGGAGQVGAVRVGGSAAKYSGFKRCVVSRASGHRFASDAKGRTVVVGVGLPKI